MGRQNAPKFSEEQRAACVGAVLEGGMSAAEAAAAAAAGELGAPPFDAAASTVQGWVAAHQRREGVQLAGLPEAERIHAVAEKTIARVEALGDQATAKDLHALKQAYGLLNDAQRMTRRIQPAKPQRQPNAETAALIADMEAHCEKLTAVEGGAPCDHQYATPQGEITTIDPWGYCTMCRERLATSRDPAA